MRIRHRLTLGFLTIVLLAAAIGYTSVYITREAMRKAIGQKGTDLAVHLIGEIDRTIFRRIETFQEYSRDCILQEVLSESNKRYGLLPDVDAYVQEQDEMWRSATASVMSAEMRALISNELSEELSDKTGFYCERYGYPVYPEVFVTNRYGANVAQTGPTSDFNQADEQWWQTAKEDGVYVGELEYDESCDAYAVSIGIGVHDGSGAFAGVIKAVLNLKELTGLISAAEKSSGRETIEVKLFGREGMVIHDESGEYGFRDDASSEAFFGDIVGGEGYIIKGGEGAEGEELLCYAHSKGYRDYRGCGWLLTVEYETKEKFAPVTRLTRAVLMILLVLIISVVVLGVFIARSISRPIQELERATVEIGAGHLDTVLEIRSDDEIGALAKSFNGMVCDLREATEERQQAEGHLRQTKGELERQIRGLAEAREAALNIMEDAEEARQDAEQANKQLREATVRANEMAAQARAASAAKGEFVANMSHEIRTPLNAITGFTQLLADGHLSESERKYVDIIQDSGKALLQLINDILDFSKMEAGKLEVEIGDCSVGDLLNSVESMTRPQAVQNGLEFQIIKRTELPAVVRTDETRVRQCLLNLISNAVKFTETGHIHVYVSMCEHEEQPCLCLEVEDTGIGIAPDRQEAVFESFTQADGSTTRKYGGTGLGLSITDRLVRLLGGRLSLASEPGRGSKFSLKIPVEVAALAAGESVAEKGAIASASTEGSYGQCEQSFTGTVLLAEDDRTNQMLASILLTKLGFEVFVANDGCEAVEMAGAGSFDVILMDMQMPNMNGYEATAKLREKGASTPIIALTANAMQHDRQACIDAGCDDYLSKPIDRDELLRVVSRYASAEAHDGAERAAVNLDVHE